MREARRQVGFSSARYPTMLFLSSFFPPSSSSVLTSAYTYPFGTRYRLLMAVLWLLSSSEFRLSLNGVRCVHSSTNVYSGYLSSNSRECGAALYAGVVFCCPRLSLSVYHLSGVCGRVGGRCPSFRRHPTDNGMRKTR